ncbi:MAG: lipoate--protein ligase family protein, partial [Candidatus Heimdallarchaeota archaeon]|nr:lipoate--protein ligase family protein [Candidatus Heimdallarchaeota archaeon]
SLDHSIFINLINMISPITIRFWRNNSSVILGRGQSLHEEVNLEYCKSNNIEITRRISGGGCVYQDLGNYNCSLYFPIKLINGDLQTIGSILSSLIIDSFPNSNDFNIIGSTNILFRNQKISGAATYISKGWILHHFTMLINANLDHLENSLLVKDNIKSERRRSKYLPTTNLLLDYNAWKYKFIQKVSSKLGIKFSENTLQEEELELSELLYHQIYTDKNWINRGKRNQIQFRTDKY